MLDEEIKKARIQAMKDHNRNVSDVLSIVMNKVMLAKIDKREKRQELTDADVISILQKTEKELFDERASFEKAGRPEKVKELDEQIDAVKKFIPAMMSEDEIKEVIMSLPDKSIGSVMKHFKTNYAGKCDMKLVGEVFKRI